MTGCWVLIGGHGFIGSHLTQHLVQKGATVVRIGSHKKITSAIPAVTDVYLDERGLEPHSKLISGAKWVIYLAHRGRPNPETSDRSHLERECVQPLLNALQYFKEVPIAKFVYLSTGGAMYNSLNKTVPLNETEPCFPVSDYGKIKFHAEEIIQNAWRGVEKPFLIVRPSNGYGWPRNPQPETGFIPLAIRNIYRGLEVPVYGLPGTTRDYIHVSDIIRGIYRLAQQEKTDHVYHLSTGVGKNNLEILEYLRPLASHHGLKIKIQNLPARSCDVDWAVLSSEKAKKHCGWKPLVSISEGIANMWREVANG